MFRVSRRQNNLKDLHDVRMHTAQITMKKYSHSDKVTTMSVWWLSLAHATTFGYEIRENDGTHYGKEK